MTTRLLLLFAVLTLAAGCKKDALDPDGLVPATRSGKNTGDFLLNGQPWGPQASITSPGNPVGAFWDNFGRGRHMQISLFREERDANRTRRVCNIILSNIKSAGTFHLKDLVNPSVVSGSRSYIIYEVPGVFPAVYKDYLTGPSSPGKVIITRYDTVARVVSGTFEAKLREYQGPDSLALTKGRFDCTF